MSAKFTDDARQRGFEDAALVHDGEGHAHHKDEYDDDDDGQVIGTRQHFEWGGEPAPDGIVGTLSERERIGDDGLAPVHFEALELSRGDDEGQDARENHQRQQDDRGLDKRLLADLRA